MTGDYKGGYPISTDVKIDLYLDIYLCIEHYSFSFDISILVLI